MKSIIAGLSLFMTFGAWAQFTVAPFGASGVSAPPIGESNNARCSNGNCSLEINVKPYCFGTNLRVYTADTQLRPDGQVGIDFNLKDPKNPSKKDSLKVVFPGKMTFASDGVRMDCQFKAGQNMKQPGYKDITCTVPWQNNTTYSYKLNGWLESRNAVANTDQPWVRYAARPLSADLVGGSSNIDSNITCLYKFTENNPWNAQLLETAVSCYFPSQLPDMSNLVKVYKDGTDITSAVSVSATTNNINVTFKDSLKSMPTDVAVKHGQVLSGKVPEVSVSYSQDNAKLAAIKEKEAFDDNADNKRLQVVVKFPGTEGFCGGFYSPLMFFFSKDTPRFDGVSLFPLYGANGRVNWPEAGSPGHFLARLKKGEDKISKSEQLFGQSAEHQNGFEALKVHDKNNDGVITKKDPVWKELKLWNDKNGDGLSEKSEIVSLEKMGVQSIELKYSDRDVTKFENRARAREKSKFTYKQDGKIVKADVYDVWLAPID